MSFYRYAMETKEQYIRSLTPLTEHTKNLRYFSYRFYTSQKENPPDLRVISIGCEKSWPIKVKTQGPSTVNRFNLRYVVQGEGLFCGQPVRKGDFFFTTPYEEYKIVTNTDRFEYYYIGVAGNGLEDILKNTGFYSIPKICKCPFIDRIPDLFSEALFQPHPAQDIDYYLFSLFMMLMSFHKPCNNVNASTAADTTLMYYQQALSYIRDYLSEGITPHDIADFLHLSPSYLRAIFGKHCQYSLQEYLIRTRIKYAADQLAQTNCSVRAAARSVGYEDTSLFSKIFKKYMGVSPLLYQKTQANKPN